MPFFVQHVGSGLLRVGAALPAMLLGTMLILAGECCWAQSRGVLFSQSALLRANREGGLGSVAGSATSLSLGNIVESSLSLDTVDDLVLLRDEPQAYSSQYRAFYNMYFAHDDLSFEYLDPELVDELSRRVALYQSAVTLSDLLKRSPVGNIYRRLTDSIVEYREYITLRVRRSGGGDLSLGRSGPRDTELLEFRVNANPQRGIEPRLRLIDDFLLKYDTIAGGAVLEYNVNF